MKKQWQEVVLEIERFHVTDILTVSGETSSEISSEITFEDED